MLHPYEKIQLLNKLLEQEDTILWLDNPFANCVLHQLRF
jgi:hypothetical protein